MPPDLEYWILEAFGFIPKRYDPSLLATAFPGGSGAKVWTFVTYSLLHANLSHIGFNVLWLLPFGSAVARRFGAVRFFLFMAVAAIAGAIGVAGFALHKIDQLGLGSLPGQAYLPGFAPVVLALILISFPAMGEKPR